MGKKKAVLRLGAGELEFLEMLWREDGVTILEAQQALGLPISYSTVQTRLNRLVKKGVAQKSSERPARYRAAISPDAVRRDDLDLLVHRVSQGDVVPLVAHLVGGHPLSRRELDEIKQLIRDAETRLTNREPGDQA